GTQCTGHVFVSSDFGPVFAQNCGPVTAPSSPRCTKQRMQTKTSTVTKLKDDENEYVEMAPQTSGLLNEAASVAEYEPNIVETNPTGKSKTTQMASYSLAVKSPLSSTTKPSTVKKEKDDEN